ncbi:MAG: tripartite tricarboxylate transporter permease [Clostridia bacterium]|nr:tripartite tricarboxylate transporter permease [Clostridia bacterium]
MNWGLLFESYGAVFLDPQVLLMTLLGATGGVLLGAIPGMTATMGIALLIPFSFGMDLIPSIGLLLGIYCGGMYGGSISAILIHAPGTPAAAATLLDGYPMCQKGEAGRALSIAMFASFVGGVIGALIMTFLSPVIADMAMKFGPGEMFMLAVFGLSVIVAISGKSIAKGMVSAFLGMLMCTVGLDPTNGTPRYITYSHTGLLEGFPFIPLLIGLFAVAEVIAGVERIILGEEKQEKSDEVIKEVLPNWATIKVIWPQIISGGIIGTFIGAIPGAGGDIAVFVSYGFNKSASKHPELWGTGIPQGVASTESANNGCSGGAMIPLLSLGVPGDSVTAILLGAFIMKGIQPGPMMYISELPTVYKVFAALMLANIAMLVVGCAGVRGFAKIVSIEKTLLYPIILVVSLLGAFSINKNVFDLGVTMAFGVMGYLMNKYEFPLSPILLALILGPMCEKNFVRFMTIEKGNVMAIFNSPISVAFLVVSVVTVLFSVWNQNKINKREAAAKAAEKAAK